MTAADSACPYCRTEFAKRPQRKTKCRTCGNAVFVRSAPDDPERRLVTAARAAEIDAAWSARHAGQRAENGVAMLLVWGVDESQARALVGDGSNLPEVMERLAHILVTDGVTERQRNHARRHLEMLARSSANQVSHSSRPTAEHVAQSPPPAPAAPLWRRLLNRLF